MKYKILRNKQDSINEALKRTQDLLNQEIDRLKELFKPVTVIFEELGNSIVSKMQELGEEPINKLQESVGLMRDLLNETSDQAINEVKKSLEKANNNVLKVAYSYFQELLAEAFNIEFIRNKADLEPQAEIDNDPNSLYHDGSKSSNLEQDHAVNGEHYNGLTEEQKLVYTLERQEELSPSNHDDVGLPHAEEDQFVDKYTNSELFDDAEHWDSSSESTILGMSGQEF